MSNSNTARPPRRAKRFLLGIAVSILCVLLMGSVLEVYLRVTHSWENLRPSYYDTRKPTIQEHPFLPFAGVPSDNRTLKGFVGSYDVTYTTNSYGFVGGEFTKAKGENEIRIIAFGGSTTWCPGIDVAKQSGTMADTWPAILERSLQARYPHLRITVYNLAQCAYSSPMSVVNNAFVAASLSPDFVLSYDGINDMLETFDFDMRTDYAGRFGRFSGMKSVGLPLPTCFFNSYAVCWIVKKCDRVLGYTRSQSVLGTVFPEERRQDSFGGNWWNSASLKNIELFYRNQKTMRAISREFGAVFIAATLHYREADPLRNEYNQKLREFYAKEKIPYFDADAALPKNDPTVTVDDVHFAKRGCELMAEGFRGAIEPYLAGKGTQQE